MVGAKDILIKIKGDNENFEKTMGESDKSTKKFAKTLGTALVAGAIAAAGALTILISNSLELSKELSLLNLKLNISVENLSALKFAVGKTGVEFDDFTEGLKDLTIKQGEAAQGNEGVMKTFNDLGVSIYKTDGSLKDIETLFYDVSKAVQSIEDPARRVSILNQLMADNGYKVIPIVMDIQQIQEDTDYAKIHDLVITDDEVKQLAEFKGEMSELAYYTEVFGVSLATSVLPYLTGFNDEVGRAVENDGIPRLVNIIVGAVEALYGFLKVIKNIIDIIYKGFIMTAAIFTDLIGLTDDLTEKMSVSIGEDLQDLTEGAGMWKAGGKGIAYGLTGEGGYLESAQQLRGVNEDTNSIDENTNSINDLKNSIDENTTATDKLSIEQAVANKKKEIAQQRGTDGISGAGVSDIDRIVAAGAGTRTIRGRTVTYSGNNSGV